MDVLKSSWFAIKPISSSHSSESGHAALPATAVSRTVRVRVFFRLDIPSTDRRLVFLPTSISTGSGAELPSQRVGEDQTEQQDVHSESAHYWLHMLEEQQQIEEITQTAEFRTTACHSDLQEGLQLIIKRVLDHICVSTTVPLNSWFWLVKRCWIIWQ